ncbi:rifin [Plasmodium falciparum NF54]|uniref:Rifin n=2 Tax=Plasmodium falciparum TaxID=5833 RepID=Q8I642_PLAF7|nr:rifin [Plasmodium falciparum 3D7]KAF4327180.1 rifin [Plasmodium falciparum NF54]PKC48229.1 rifin [Plasmodium falciparum NF54]CZT99164.1 rifin [Plasmodium falciparum 3D7]|eukprot:XP_001350411.1 rifin [Plasmodium falciparum 3D7]
MKIHYINILLFALPLNILIYNQRNHNSTTHHTLKIPITRLLCECELYSPSNYDNDPQLKKIMENFNKQTQQRFEEYDERMKTTRQKCKDKCDKEIQKIILKDKLEKELMDKFATLQTDIQSDDIPTCVCEKSLADKVEKNCMKCTQNLGGIVAPSSGVLAGIAELGLNAWKTTEITAAIAAAEQAGAAKGLAAGAAKGVAEVIAQVESQFHLSTIGVNELGSVINVTNYNNSQFIFKAIFTKYRGSCLPSPPDRLTVAAGEETFCRTVNALGFTRRNVFDPSLLQDSIKSVGNQIVTKAETAASTETAKVTASETATLKAAKVGEVNATYMGYQTPIIVSIAAIVVIVLVMVIIYLILRYRRKKKMKKKLQYIKLLKE